LCDGEDPTRNASREAGEDAWQTGWNVVERLLGHQHEPGEAFGVAGGGQLRSAPVDGDKGHVAQVEALDELREEIGDAMQ